jgi:hypothetical protein
MLDDTRDFLVRYGLPAADDYSSAEGALTNAYQLAGKNLQACQVEADLSASVGTWTDIYAKVSYTTDIDGNFQSSFSGRLGFRLTW